MIEDNQWELSKENAQPLKKGRSAMQPIMTGFVSAEDKANFDKQKDNYEESLATTKLSLSERLDLYVQYYTWIRRTTTSNLNGAKTILERCTKEMTANEDMKNDPRLLKIWIEYADVSSDSNDIFTYMYTNKIGVRHALFWIAWAFVAEKVGNMKFADQIYLKGQKYLAEPKDLLSKRYHQFQRRMTRKFLNNEDIDTLPAVPEKRSDRPPQRKGLSVISDKPVNIPSHDSKKEKAVTSSGNFQIFTDNGGANENNPKPVKESWNNLGKESERRKENTEIAQKWTNVQIIPDASTAKAPQPLTFQIFDDSAAPTIPNQTAPIVSSAKNYTNVLVDEGEEDGTINTKLALQDIEAFFTSPAKVAAPAKPMTQAPASLSFQIFSDAEPPVNFNIDVSAIKPNQQDTMIHALDDLEDLGEFEDIDDSYNMLKSRREICKSHIITRIQNEMIVDQPLQLLMAPSQAGIFADSRQIDISEYDFVQLQKSITESSHPHYIDIGVREEHLLDFSFQTIWRLTDKNSPNTSSICQVNKMIGEGGFGRVYVVSISQNEKLRTCALKCSKRHYSIKWEILIHAMLRLRLSPIVYHRIAVGPIALCHLKDASALLLPLGQLGTLWNLTNSLIALSVSEKEKEVIAAQMCLELINAVRHLHQASIAHGDIKLDNWLVDWHDQRLSLKMIDLGKSILLQGATSASNTLNANNVETMCFVYQCAINSARTKNDVALVDIHCNYVRDLEQHDERYPHNECFGIQRDLFCIASCLHQLLHHQKLETLKNGWGTIKPSTGFKRYWKYDLWERIFSILLNYEGKSYDDRLYEEMISYASTIHNSMDVSHLEKLNWRIHDYLKIRSSAKLK